ncbi:MAG: tetratricopeptide repeat protein [Deinococcus sp.]|nr:tetratricopeptide repeat protein [Deinococcus sp.]
MSMPTDPDPVTLDLERRVAANPQDLEALLALGHRYLEHQQPARATETYQRVIDLDAQNREAWTHLGLILFWDGRSDDALRVLDQVLADSPEYPEALFFKGVVLYEARQDYAGAVAAWEAYLAVTPPGQDTSQVRGLLQEARARLVTVRGEREGTP